MFNTIYVENSPINPSSNAGKALRKTANQMIGSTLGDVNGFNSWWSFGILRRSPESLRINEQYHGWFNRGSGVFEAGPWQEVFPGGGRGPVSSPALALGGRGGVIKVTNVLTTFAATIIVLSNAASKNSKELSSSYEVPDEHAVSGEGFLGGLAYLNNEEFSTAMYLKNDDGSYKTKRGTPAEREIFGILYNKIIDQGGKIQAIIGNWNTGDNLAEFNKLLKNGYSLQDAALGTFTGSQAKQRGFTAVEKIGGTQMADGTYKSVNIKCRKLPNLR